jgi:hypothetical protein
MSGEHVKLQVSIPVELKQELGIYCIKRGVTLSSAVEEALVNYLKAQESK